MCSRARPSDVARRGPADSVSDQSALQAQLFSTWDEGLSLPRHRPESCCHSVRGVQGPGPRPVLIFSHRRLSYFLGEEAWGDTAPRRARPPSPFPWLSGDFPHSQDQFQVESLRGHRHLGPCFAPQPPHPSLLPLELLWAERETTPAAEAKPETKASATASPRARPGTFLPSLQLRKGRSDSALSARCRRSKTVAGCPGQIAGNLTLTGRNM